MWEWFTGILTAILGGIQGVVGDWGLAIIILTVFVRLLLTPLMAKSTASTARMQVMQPKLQELQERYADDPVRQSEEMRKLYADMNFNPLGGCLPILLQMPIFFGLFSVIKQVPEEACFFGILPSISMSASDVFSESGWIAAIPYIVLVILFGALTFLPMVMNLKTTTDPQQRQQSIMMGAVMSIMMLWMGWSWASAVLLYYVTSSSWQVVQQKLITQRVIEKAKAEAEEKAANAPLEVDVVRKEKRKRPHKKS